MRLGGLPDSSVIFEAERKDVECCSLVKVTWVLLLDRKKHLICIIHPPMHSITHRHAQIGYNILTAYHAPC